MSSTSSDSVVDALEAVGVTPHETTPARFPETIRSVVEPPAVGVPLSIPGVSLSGTPITVDPTPAELKAAKTGVTGAMICIREYGSLVVPSDSKGTELVSLFVDRHVVVLDDRDVVPDMRAAIDALAAEIAGARSSAVIATGPSATADMGALVQGAHGPSEVHAVLVSDE